jgi:uncharacterized DUF497 family protein
VEITFDTAKNERNTRERGLSFERAAQFDFSTALRSVDARRDYGEIRHVAFGYLDRQLHALCFVETPTGIQVISFRRANRREIRRYENAQAAHR